MDKPRTAEEKHEEDFSAVVKIQKRSWLGYKKRYMAVVSKKHVLMVYKNSRSENPLYLIELENTRLNIINKRYVIEITGFERTYRIKSSPKVFGELVKILPTLTKATLYKRSISKNFRNSTNDILRHNAPEFRRFESMVTMRRSRVDLDSFDKISVIGRGNFGKVYLVKKKDTGTFYAMKSIQKGVLLKHGQQEGVIAEKLILMKVANPFLVSLHYSFQSSEKLYLILDYVGGGDLFTHMRNYGPPGEVRARKYIAEIILALEHLHKLGIVYRDLKTENILIDYDGHLKLTDFGLSRLESTTDFTFSQTYNESLCGTIEYLAPEIIRRDPYGKAIDWWAAGILLYEMIVGLPPFYSKNSRKMVYRILNEDVRFPDYMDKNAVDLITKLLDKNASTRLGSSKGGAAEIKNHPYFDGLDWDDVYQKKIDPGFRPRLLKENDTRYFEREFTEMSVKESFPEVSVLSISKDSSIFDGFTFNKEEADGVLGSTTMREESNLGENF